MCNCNKGKTPPPPPPPPEQPAVVASGTAKTQSFAFQPPTGARRTFGSMLEAQAARVRAGGGRITSV